MGEQPVQTILVVDDPCSLTESARHALASRGFAVFHANSPDEALTHWRARQPRIDLVVLDMVTPSPCNLDLAAQLERLRRGLPVLYLVGAGAAGIDPAGSVLAQPFTEEELVARVESLLNMEAGAGQKPDEDLWERLIADSDRISSGAALLYLYELGQAALAAGHVNMLLGGRIRYAFRPTNYAAAPYSMIVRAVDFNRARRLIAQFWLGGQSVSAAWAPAE